MRISDWSSDVCSSDLIEEDRYVMLEDDELEAVGLESTRTIDIEQFVPADSIEWVWYDTPYYLMPDDEVAQEAFAVIREAMAATDTVGISRLGLAARERRSAERGVGKEWVRGGASGG